MKKVYLVLSILLISLYAVCSFRENKSPKKQNPWNNRSSGLNKGVSNNTTSENPEDRLEFEYRQLLNPENGRIPTLIRHRELAFAKGKLNHQENEKSSNSEANSSTNSNEQTTDYSSIGPFNVGGRTRGLGIDINNENVILAGGVSGGVWRSTNGGETWQRSTALEDHPAVTTLIQDRRSGKTNEWYYGTGERTTNTSSINGDIYLGNGIYKSIDNGASWSLIETTSVVGTSGTDVITEPNHEFAYVDQLAIDYSNTIDTEVYAAVSSEIIRSEDGFETYQIVLGEGNEGSNSTDIAITSEGKVFATIGSTDYNGLSPEDGYFKSDDGLNWVELELPDGFPTNFKRTEIAIDPSNEKIVYFISSLNLFKYNDETEVWEDLSAFIDANRDSPRGGHNSQDGYNLFAKVHPDNGASIFAGGTNLLRSTDGFKSNEGRSQIGGYAGVGKTGYYQNHHPDNHDLWFYDSDGKRAISASDGGLNRTNDIFEQETTDLPVDWESLNNGYLTSQFYHIDINNSTFGNPQVMGGMQDNGTWIGSIYAPEEDWFYIGTGDGSFAGITYNAHYISAQRGVLFKESLNDQGQYISDGEITPSDNASEFSFINPYIYNPVNQDQLFVGALGRIYITNDIRDNPRFGEWISIDFESPRLNFVSAFGFSSEPSGVLYFGTADGGLYKFNQTSNINSETEALKLNTADLPNGNISGIAIDPMDADKVLVTFSNYEVQSIWYSKDGGENWSPISGNLEENEDGSGAGPSIKAVNVMPDGNGGNYYFAGTSVGLFMTQSLEGLDTNWEQQGDNALGNVLVSSIASRSIEGLVVVATHGNGAFTAAYDVGVNANVNYSINNDGAEYLLRANGSAVNPSPLTYQWIKDGEDIEGETGETLTVTDGGAYQVRLAIEGTSGTGLSNTVNINLDGQGPEVSTITRLDPADAATDQTTVQFQVTFNETVLNVSTDDFETVSAASGTIASVVESTVGTVFDVTVSNIGGSGELNLDIASSTDITDEVGNAFSGTVLSEETFTITDNTDPTGSINRSVPATEVTDQNEVTFLVTFSEGVDNVDVTDFTLAAGSPTATLGAVTEVSAISYQVVVTDILADGTLGLDFAAGQDILDKAGNAFDGVAVTDETYTIENVITSIDDPLARAAERIIVDANPSSGVFNLAFPPAYIGDFEMQIVDSQGRKVLTRGVKNYNTGDQVEINLTNSPDGVYILAASNGSVRSTIKLLKSEGSR